MSQEENNKAVVRRENYKPPTKKDGKNYLLVIGIDAYAHCPTLYNAVKDAQDIVEVLETRFQFESKNIKILYNQAATKSNIYKAFEYFAETVTTADNFLLYFSGHGEFKKSFNEGYWIPVEAELKATYQFISNSECKKILSAIKSHHTFLMADSCFSGSFFAKGTRKNISLRKERDPSRWGLTAGRNEIVTDGIPGKNSPFAESILYQLRNADKPLGVAELCNKVLEVVAANADQTPRGEPLKIAGHQGGQFVFHLKMDERVDWKKALTTKTVAAFQSFVSKYPDSKNTPTAQEKIKIIQAASLWQKIEMARDNTFNEVSNKLLLLNQYADKYENQVHYEEALNLGELLAYKKQFLQAQSSKFALRRFLQKPLPSVDGVKAIKSLARTKLTNWGNTSIEKEEPTKISPQVKKKIEEKPIIKPKPQPIVVKPHPPIPSFLERYGKYLLFLLVLLPGYGINEMINNSSANMNSFDDIMAAVSNVFKDLAKVEQGYDTYLYKGNAELLKNTPNYQIAKKHYQAAINAAEGSEIDTKEAKIGIKKCKDGLDEESNRMTELVTVGKKIIHNYFWLSAKSTNTIIAYEAYQKKYSNGKYNIDAINQIEKLKAEAPPVDSGTFIDVRDGQSYQWLRLEDGKKWMTQNLNYAIKNSWCYDDSTNCTKFGRLYNWSLAKKVCPDEWRLPTDNDWKNMADYYGGSTNDKDKNSPRGKEAYSALMDSNGFSASLGGIYSNSRKFEFFGNRGYYWSSTNMDYTYAWRYIFKENKLHRGFGGKSVNRSCRCIQD